MFAVNVCVKSFIHRDLPCQSVFIGQSHGCQSLRNRAKAKTRGSNVSLSRHIRSSANDAESQHGWIGERVLADRLKPTPGAAMIEFYCTNFWGVKGSRTLSL